MAKSNCPKALRTLLWHRHVTSGSETRLSQASHARLHQAAERPSCSSTALAMECGASRRWARDSAVDEPQEHRGAADDHAVDKWSNVGCQGRS